MSEVKHTPGPWHLVNGTQIRSAKHQIAKVWMMRGREGTANARLIAAAPELLDLVEEAMSMLGSQLIKDTLGYDWHEKANAAIAKVTVHPHD